MASVEPWLKLLECQTRGITHATNFWEGQPVQVMLSTRLHSDTVI
jgi:hypothetical protein